MFQIRIFTQLVNQHGVRKDNIAILSQYKAQCSGIEKNLKDIGFENPRVSTVVASQGKVPYSKVYLNFKREVTVRDVTMVSLEGSTR